MSYTIDLSNTTSKIIMTYYKDYSISHTNNYTLFRAKYKGSTLTIFKTNTMIIQGSDCQDIYKEVCHLLEITPNFKESSNSELSVTTSHIGTDEVGTGDFFGGITVAAAFVPENKIKFLKELGIKDSKLLSNSKIEEIAPKMMKEIKYSVLLLDNIKYNFLTKVHHFNMNKIKAMLHNTVIKNIVNKVCEEYEEIVIDGFTTSDKYFEYLEDEKEVIRNKVKLVEKGESKYISIAAASIIARYLFLSHMNKLSKEVGFDLPKGAGPKVDKAIEKIIKERSEKYLEVIGKTNFKNLIKIKKDI